MSLILRQAKGEKLTIVEMDDNLTYLEDLATSNSGSNYEQTVGSQTTILSGATGSIVSVSITINNHPVLVTVTGDANNATAGGWCHLQLYRDGSPIGNIVQCESSGANENVPYSISYVDEPGTGNFTYTLEAVEVNGSNFVFGETDGPVISAIELVTGGAWAESDNTIDDSVRSNSKGGEYNVICCSVNSTIIGGSSNEIFGSGDGYYSGAVYNSGIFGGRDNLICNSGQSVIIGGCDNQICTSDDYNAIIAGCNNRICGSVDYSAIVGGACNMIYGDADADYSAIVGGCCNENCYSELSVILGGACNLLDNSNYSGILGGGYNCICDSEKSAILGGCENRILDNSDNSTIVGGEENCINFSCSSAIISGYCNLINYDSDLSTIIGGYCNWIQNDSNYSTIVGGYDNCMCCNVQGSSIISGDDNCMIGGCSTFTLLTEPYTQYCTTGFICTSSVLAGCNNKILNQVRNSAIIGGFNNDICGTVCQVSESSYYTCTTCDSVIIGSEDSCIINSQKSTIIGSEEGRIFDSCYSQIIGSKAYNDGYYYCNQILDSRASSIISVCSYNGVLICNSNGSSIIASNGGETTTTAIAYSTNVVIIGANEGVIVESCESFILGGCENSLGILGGAFIGGVQYSGILGGEFNDIFNSCSSTIIGGRSNLIYGASGSICSSNTSIIGGANNTICGSLYSSIIGGQLNSMTASNCSVIIGGSNFSLDSCNDVVMVPKLITGTFGSMAAWKLGATASAVGATVQTNQYIEVEVNGITYKLALIS